MPRYIEITCPEKMREIISNALDAYIECAFPAGSSDCAMVAREELLEAAKLFVKSHKETGTGKYNKRIRAFVAEAIKLYYKNQPGSNSRESEQAFMLKACKGGQFSEEDFHRSTPPPPQT